MSVLNFAVGKYQPLLATVLAGEQKNGMENLVPSVLLPGGSAFQGYGVVSGLGRSGL